ncbi:UNVERIFIED_CONTAM: hypothetical protein Sradi_3600100 [Sesamum radiatum]|uniref:Uncharacterized protein n=1 Tax=Sesamum radiatum TaxID=300843 RepID=A0AAW2QGX4_SESRA
MRRHCLYGRRCIAPHSSTSPLEKGAIAAQIQGAVAPNLGHGGRPFNWATAVAQIQVEMGGGRWAVGGGGEM